MAEPRGGLTIADLLARAQLERAQLQGQRGMVAMDQRLATSPMGEHLMRLGTEPGLAALGSPQQTPAQNTMLQQFADASLTPGTPEFFMRLTSEGVPPEAQGLAMLTEAGGLKTPGEREEQDFDIFRSVADVVTGAGPLGSAIDAAVLSGARGLGSTVRSMLEPRAAGVVSASGVRPPGVPRGGVPPATTRSQFLDPADPDLTAATTIRELGVSGDDKRGLSDIARLLNEDAKLKLAPLGQESAEAMQRRLSRLAAADTAQALEDSPDVAAWYGKNILETQHLAALEHPELLKDRNALSAFNYGFAVTSNGTAVPLNSQTALEVYDYYKANNGRFPLRGLGERVDQMKGHFKAWNDGVERFGLDNWVKFLNSDHTGAQLKAFGYSPSGVKAGDTVKGSAILGPKIGGAFFQNLEGNFDVFTLDMWMRRNLGRGTGTVVAANPARMATAAGRFIDALRNPQGRARMEEMLGEALPAIPNDDDALADLADRIYSKWGRTNIGGRTFAMSGVAEADEAMRASRELAKLAVQPGSGFSSGERILQNDALHGAVGLLQDAGINVKPADMQALLWGQEQGVWRQLGGRVKETTNFARETARLMEIKGHGRRKVQAAVARGGRPAPGSAIGQPPARFDPRGQREFAADVVSGDLRAAVARSSRADGGRVHSAGSGRLSKHTLSDGSEASIRPRETVASYSLPKPLAGKLKAHGMSDGATQELVNNGNTLRIFQDRAKAAQTSRGDLGLSVTVHSDPVDYADKRLFLSADGSYGYALDGDDIVSVFNAADGPHKGVTPALINQAVDLGGRRLDAFNILSASGESGLPRLYSRAGMVPVTKLRFDPEFPPEGMTAGEWAAWGEKHGNPDLIFMAYDPKAKGRFDLKGLRYSQSYEGAQKAQRAAVRRHNGSFNEQVQGFGKEAGGFDKQVRAAGKNARGPTGKAR